MEFGHAAASSGFLLQSKSDDLKHSNHNAIEFECSHSTISESMGTAERLRTTRFFPLQ